MLPVQLNVQPPEKADLREDGSLDIHSVFYTIQGEGPFAGCPAVFVRLAGCNLQCPDCDTEYTVGRKRMSVEEIVSQVRKVGFDNSRAVPMIVLTGGEPFRQNISPLVREVKSWLGFEHPVQIETNGTEYLPDFPYAAVTVVCSPKAGRVQPGLQTWVKHLKYVVEAGHTDPDDGLPTSVLGNGIRPARPWPMFHVRGTIWVQPIDVGDPNQNQVHMQEAVDTCMKYGYRLSIQGHKIAGLP